MDVKYTPNGPPGQTCADCAMFAPDRKNKFMGSCFGHEVLAAGSCNYFKKR